jgi:hypothetical protein
LELKACPRLAAERPQQGFSLCGRALPKQDLGEKLSSRRTAAFTLEQLAASQLRLPKLTGLNKGLDRVQTLRGGSRQRAGHGRGCWLNMV